jgi:hypothetical protein
MDGGVEDIFVLVGGKWKARCHNLPSELESRKSSDPKIIRSRQKKCSKALSWDEDIKYYQVLDLRASRYWILQSTRSNC